MKTQRNRLERLADNQIRFQAYGVKIGIKAEKEKHLRKVYRLLERVFPNGLEEVPEREITFHFWIESNIESNKEEEKENKNEKKFDLYLNEDRVIENLSEELFYETVESKIRVTVAEFAAGKVFLHAGVVAWKGRAIVIPGRSYAGKTTLVAELSKRGALYYSDEYAVLDHDGKVEPFAKWLSLRGIIDDHQQLDCSVESLGGRAGTETLPVGMILFARFDRGKKNPRRWNPKSLSQGQAVMEILPHTLPIINKPKFVLEVLNKLTARAIIVKTVRGEAKEFAETLLKYFEKETK